VETLKRDWDVKLTLRDVLVTICCLLVQPNASSALNAEAGMFLEQGDWSQFERRARMMTRLQAGVPKHLKEAVLEAQRRGEESEELERKDSALHVAEASRTRRRAMPLSRGLAETPVEGARKGMRAGTPPPPPTRAPPPSRPFVRQSIRDDVFGAIRLPMPQATPIWTNPYHGANPPTITSTTRSSSSSARSLNDRLRSRIPTLAEKGSPKTSPRQHQHEHRLPTITTKKPPEENIRQPLPATFTSRTQPSRKQPRRSSKTPPIQHRTIPNHTFHPGLLIPARTKRNL
jgi:hypothetical protein